MKLLDIIITIICGEALALVMADFLKEYDGVFEIAKWTFLFLFPVLAIMVFWFADLIWKEIVFVLQLIKYLLIGVLAMLIDLKIFGLLIWFLGSEAAIVAGVSKGISFMISMSAKFIGNKYWTFEERKTERIKEEFLRFLTVTFIGLLIDVGCFFYFSKIMGPQFGLPFDIWVKASIVLAGIAAAAWNFLSYKFIVFPARGGSALGGKKQNDSTISQI